MLEDPLRDLSADLRAQGFAFAPAATMREALGPLGVLPGWAAFAASWDDLGLDTYMADGGRYRRRRHAVFRAEPGAPIQREPHQPHWQSRDYNTLNGGIQRWFDPVLPEVADGAALQGIMGFCRALFERQSGAQDWKIEVHQFRIEARPDEAGKPTPEGAHRDGVDHVLVLMVARTNIAEGHTTIHGADGETLGSFTLTEPMDAALVDDHRVAHGVTPVRPLDPTQPARRDVLVVTFARR